MAVWQSLCISCQLRALVSPRLDFLYCLHQHTFAMKGDDAERLKPLTPEDFRTFAERTGLSKVAVEQLTRYRQIHWPFYHQFMVVTTVKIQPPPSEFNMFLLQTEDGGKVVLDDLDPAVNGISFRIDRGSRSQLGVEGVNGLEFGSQGNFDRIEILRPGTKPLGGPEASSFEVIWRLTRKPDLDPTQFSLAVGDISLFVEWISQINPKYDLLRNNCWILSTSISHLTMYHFFHHEFDKASQPELEAMRVSHGLIRRRVSKFFSGPSGSIRWLALKNRQRTHYLGEQVSAENRPRIPFLSHPDRAGFGLLLKTCATSSTPPAGFAKQPDDVLHSVCLRLSLLVADWRIQIEADPKLKDDFHRFIEEFSAMGLYRPVMTMRPDIRWAYANTMALIYETIPTSRAVSSLSTESVGTQYIRCIPQYIEYLKKGNFRNDDDLQAILLVAVRLVRIPDGVKELVRLDMLSVLVQVFRHERRIKPKSWDDFDLLLMKFCTQNPASREYFLKSEALFHVRNVLMRRPQSPRLITALHFLTTTESVDDLHGRLISCGVLVPLSRCLALTDFDNNYISMVPEIFISLIEHKKGVHLLTRPILSYLARSLNHPFSFRSFVRCGEIFKRLCALGDHAKEEVVKAGALPGLCRLAHHDTYEAKYEGTHLLYEELLVNISRIDPAVVAAARKRYGRGFKVQTSDTPRQAIWGRAQAIVTRLQI